MLDGVELAKNVWKQRGVKEQIEYSILTAEISKAAFGLTPSEYKTLKVMAGRDWNPTRSDQGGDNQFAHKKLERCLYAKSSFWIFRAQRSGLFVSSCSQIRKTRQPSFRNMRLTFRSRMVLPATFPSQ